MEEKMETNQRDLETVEEDIENSNIQIINDDHDDQVVNIDDPTENEGKTSNVYKENSWPQHPEVPKGYTFKGKARLFTFAVDKTKSALKKGKEKEHNDIKFKVLDVRRNGGATQETIETSNDGERGNAIIDFWGPNKR